MDSGIVYAFTKHALSMGTLKSYLGARAAQGVGGAEALGRSLTGSVARTSRQAVGEMSGLEKHRLGGVMQGGKEVRQMQRLPSQVGLGQTTQQTRARVGHAVRQEAANPTATRQGGVPLSKAYEGYMTGSKTSYNPQHIEQVMGLRPGQHVSKAGPTALMKPRTRPQGSFEGSDEVTAPSISGLRQKVVDPVATTLAAGSAARPSPSSLFPSA